MATTENGTYYPSDYSSVADVPSDMKKMAESIDANKVQKVPGKTLSTNDFTNEYKQKLDNLENYDDTETKEEIQEIKENITQIEEEQETQNANIENLQENDTTQDELIEKLQQENKNIKSALINVETEQAKSLHIEDASTVSAQLNVEGNAEQDGEPSPENKVPVVCLGSNKNLFSENYYGLFSGNQSATKEIINNKDKEIKVTTTANAYSGIFLNTTSEAMQELIEQINGKTVTYSFEAKADTNINLQIGRSSNAKIVNLNNEWQKFDITYENTNTCSIYFYNNSATVTNFYVRKIKLEEGDKATSYSPFEQGSTEIIRMNKNLLDMSNLENGGYNSAIAGNPLIKSTNPTRVRLKDVIQALSNQKYSFKMQTDKSLRYNIVEVGKDNIIKKITSITNTNSTTITTTEETAYITFLFLWQTTTQNITVEDLQDCKIQFEFGEETEYEEHQQKNYILPIQQEMLKGDYFVKESDGWKEVHTWPKIRLLNQNFKKSTKTEVSRYFVSNIVDIVEDRNNTVVLSEHFLGIPSVQNDNNELGISNYNDNGFLINIDKSYTSLDTLEEFKTFLQNNEVYAYYKTTTPTKLTCTEKQSAVLDKLNNLDLFKNTNNIITTEDIALLKLKYVVDTKTYIDNQIADMQNQLNTINELLSTTATSSILLDNLQTDLESEVM